MNGEAMRQNTGEATRVVVAVVLGCILWVLLVPVAGCAATVDVHLDNERIPSDGPVTGWLVVNIEDDIWLPRFPTLFNGGVHCIIVGPDQVARTIDSESYAGIVKGCIGTGAKRWGAGEYRMPIAIVKLDGDDFLFRDSGVYNLTFQFCVDSGLPDATASVEVYSCEGCGHSEYLDHFLHPYIICAFENGPRQIGAEVPEGPYRIALDTLRVYTLGGNIVWNIWKNDFAAFLENADYLELAQNTVDQGLQQADAIGINVEFWQAMAARYTIIRSGAVVTDGAGMESLGYHVFCR